MRTPLRILAVLFASILLVAGCGGDDDDDSAESTDTTESDAAGTSETGSPGAMDTKPEVEVPGGEPPAELQIEDLVEGSGDEATAGTVVSVHYVGVSWSTGEQFDASWDGGQPFQFLLGSGQVIAGWDQGVEGMKVGGRRQLTIPPDLGYGAQGSPPVIAPNETLVFVVDLLEVQNP